MSTIDNKIFAGAWVGGLFISTDFGNSWTKKNLGLHYGYIRGLNVIGDNIFAGTGDGGVLLSTDYGDSWAPKNKGLPASGVELLYGTKDFIIVNSDSIYISIDNGNNWFCKNGGTPHYYPAAFTSNSSYIFALIDGLGICRAKLSDLIPSYVKENIESNALFTIYPNPATDRVTVKFNSEITHDFSYSVYDALGREIIARTNNNFIQNVQNYFEIQINDLPAGIYYLTARRGTEQKTEPLIILK
jgi:hypothetical protein